MIDEENVIETIVTPSAPRVVSNEQLYIYMPIVTADSPGISSYEMSQFTIVDGKVSIRNDLFVDVATFNAYVTDMDNNFTSVYETLEKHEHDIASVADNIASVTDDITRIDQDIAAIGDDIESVHVEIVDTVADLAVVKDLIEDKQFAIAFATYFSAITYFNNLQLQNNNLRVGQNVYIKTQNVPDLWIYSIVDNRVSYTYTTDDAIVDSLRRDGQIQIGYFILSALENKLSLDGYVTDDDLAAESDKLNAAIQTLQTAVDNLESGATSANFQNGVGAGSVQQVPDRVEDGFDFTGKNPNAEAIDHSLSAVQPYGGVGDFSNSFGGKSSAQGKRSHAEGTTTIAKGNYSHAEGDNAVALGADSHAEGYATTAYGTASHSEGRNTVTGEFENLQRYGDAAHAEGNSTKAIADASHTEGYKTNTTYEAYAAHAEGYESSTAAIASHAEGYDCHISASSDGAHAEGVRTTVEQAPGAHAEGIDTFAIEEAAHAEGSQCHADGKHSHAQGLNTTAAGVASHSSGSNTKALNDNSYAGGNDVEVNGWAAIAHGHGLRAAGTAQAVFGRFNNNDGDAIFEIGNGTAEDEKDANGNITKQNRSTAFRVLNDGRAKLQSPPVDPDDVVRLGDLRNLGGTEESVNLYLHSINLMTSVTSGPTSSVNFQIINNNENAMTYLDIVTYLYRAGIRGTEYSPKQPVAQLMATGYVKKTNSEEYYNAVSVVAKSVNHKKMAIYMLENGVLGVIGMQDIYESNTAVSDTVIRLT